MFRSEAIKSTMHRIAFLTVIVLFLSTCTKNTEPAFQVTDPEAYFGRWENISPFSGAIDRILITRVEPRLLTLHLWQTCGNTTCFREAISVNSADLAEGALIFSLDWNAQSHLLNLRLTETGKLELAPADPAAGTFEKQYFSTSQTSSFYQQLELEDAQAANFTRTRLSGSYTDINYLAPGNILWYQTNEGRIGKLQVRGNDVRLTMRWHTWTPDGAVFGGQDYLSIRYSQYYDMDRGIEDQTADRSTCDFFWNGQDKNDKWLEPQNGAVFAVFHLD